MAPGGLVAYLLAAGRPVLVGDTLRDLLSRGRDESSARTRINERISLTVPARIDAVPESGRIGVRGQQDIARKVLDHVQAMSEIL